jgi:histidine phosphotransferase ChpT
MGHEHPRGQDRIEIGHDGPGLCGHGVRQYGKVARFMSEVHNLPEEALVISPPKSDLASRLASRICHDLTSPLGAIANGVELLVLSGTERSPEIDLISESVESANARLRFFRLAYGAAGRQPVGQGEVVRILSALGRGSRYTYEWAVEYDLPREEVKAAFLLLQCLETALPLGGRLRAAHDGAIWVITAEGPRLRVDLPGWHVIDSKGATSLESAAQVQFSLLAVLLVDLGRPLTVSAGPNRMEARF